MELLNLRIVHLIYITLYRTQDSKKCNVEFGAIWTHETININTFEKTHSLQQLGHGLSALAPWLCIPKLGSHMIPFSCSHGEADLNKMELTVVQQLCVVTSCSEKKADS